MQSSLGNKKLTTWSSWGCSPQTFWHLRTDHHQPIRELYTSWSLTLGLPPLIWPLKVLPRNPENVGLARDRGRNVLMCLWEQDLYHVNKVVWSEPYSCTINVWIGVSAQIHSFSIYYSPMRQCLLLLFKKYLFIWLRWVLAAACEVWFPDEGSNPCLLHWEQKS